MAQPSNHQHVYPAAHQPGHLLRRALTRLLCVLLALQPMLAQAAPALAPPATLTAPEGQVLLLAKTDTDYVQKQRREEDLLWWNERDQGRFKETVRPVEIEAGGGLRINAGRGVVIEYHKTGDLRASLGQLAEAPGLAWIAALQADPRVEWRGVSAAFREWDYAQSGLTEAGAALVALVTAVATGGMDFSQLLTSGALSGARATAFNAGMQALTVNASVALVNNKGDLAATLKQLASTDTLQVLATAVVTAGLTQNLYERFNLPLEAGANLGSLTAEQLVKKALLDTAVKTGLDTALYGADPVAALLGNLQVAAVTTVGGRLSAEIGKAYYDNPNRALQLIAESAVGCGLAAGTGGACASGAAGAVLGEIVGETFLQRQLAEQGLVGPRELAVLQRQGINVAGLAAGVVVGLAGGDINSAGQSARLVAQENATRLIVSIGRIALRLKRTLDKQGRITGQDILDSPYAELAEFITDVQTLVDPESSRVEKGMAVLNIVTGINSQTGEGARNLAARIIDKAGEIGKAGKTPKLPKQPRSVGAAENTRGIIAGNIKKIEDGRLKKLGIDAEAAKKDLMGRFDGKKFNISVDDTGSVFLTPVRKGASKPIPTYSTLDDLIEDYPLKK